MYVYTFIHIYAYCVYVLCSHMYEHKNFVCCRCLSKYAHVNFSSKVGRTCIHNFPPHYVLMQGYRGQKALRTWISTGKAKKIKHRAYLFNGMRCVPALPAMRGMM